MFKSAIACSFIFVCLFHIIALGKEPIFYKGEIELRGGDIKQGKISIELEYDVLRFYNVDGTIETYSAYNLVSFYFYDNLIQQPRSFVTLQHSPKDTKLSGYYFYELVKVGQMDILRKNHKGLDYYKFVSMPFERRVKEYDKEFDYFVYYSGELFPLKEFAKTIFPIIKNQVGEPFLKDYIRKRDIDVNHKLDPLMIIEYFNARIARENNTFRASLN